MNTRHHKYDRRSGAALGKKPAWAAICLMLLGLPSASSLASAQGDLTWSCFPNALEMIGGAEPRVEIVCAQAPPSGPWGRDIRRFALPLGSPMATRFERLANVARANGLVLTLSYELEGTNSFPGCEPADCRRPLFFGVSKQGVGQATCPIYNPLEGSGGLTNFCTAACPCQVGQGDCDTDSECAGDTRCARDVGGGFGLPTDFEVCLPSWCVDTSGSPSLGALNCWRHQGETASDEGACAPTLFLSKGKCQPCPAFDAAGPKPGFCTPACPCGGGQGGCDADEDCRGGGKVQRCAPGEGAKFGLPNDYGVCVPKYWKG